MDVDIESLSLGATALVILTLVCLVLAGTSLIVVSRCRKFGPAFWVGACALTFFIYINPIFQILLFGELYRSRTDGIINTINENKVGSKYEDLSVSTGISGVKVRIPESRVTDKQGNVVSVLPAYSLVKCSALPFFFYGRAVVIRLDENDRIVRAHILLGD